MGYVSEELCVAVCDKFRSYGYTDLNSSICTNIQAIQKLIILK